MNPSADRVLRYLAGNENIDNTSINELQKLADENPYFPVAQFLLAKKLKAGDSSGFLPQAQKTAVYFSNPHWLHYQLSDGSWRDTLSGENNFAAEETDDVNLPAIENVEKASQAEEEMAALTRDTDAATEEFLNEANTKEETFVRDNIEEVIMKTQIPIGEETIPMMEEMGGVSHQTDEATESFLNEIQTTEEEAPEHLQTAIPPFTSDYSKSKKDAETIETDEHERMFQNIKAMLDATSEEADADIENAVVPIDPYYTIDYFASQGIKLDLESNPKDQLGQHLKKFTQWLKHMKKLGPEDAAEVIRRTDTEADIQKIAESSNTVREVVTEAMACVLEKQGKNEKAIELYKKLSFLNPDKSAYFAGKIKNLKGI